MLAAARRAGRLRERVHASSPPALALAAAWDSPRSLTYLPEYVPPEPGGCAAVVPRNGIELLHDPFWNKVKDCLSVLSRRRRPILKPHHPPTSPHQGTAFSLVERDRLKLRGLLPPRHSVSIEGQVARVMDDVDTGQAFLDPAAVEDGGVDGEDVRRWKLLDNLAGRNTTLFYQVLLSDFTRFQRIVYTPTIAFAALNYHKLYRAPRGLYLSAEDAGEMLAMTYNWPSPSVDAIVITDGSRVLGLGDLGLNGMAICVGKLALYVAAAGFHPARVLPVVVDVGTDNEALRTDPLYVGLNQPRLRGAAYYRVMDEAVSALMARWPRAVLQFEDFELRHARPLLDRYKNHFHCFNDDIQGTAGTAVAGVYGALAVQGLPASAITAQRFVVVGAGSAGSGVTRMLAAGMVKHGLTFEEAAARFFILDKGGLVTTARAGGDIDPVIAPFAKGPEHEGEGLEAVVRRVRPTGLIGLAGAGRLFTPAVLAAAGEGTARPLIMPMSNPQSAMECTSLDVARAVSGGRAIFASGSPQPDVALDADWRPLSKAAVAALASAPAPHTFASSQANNSMVFPGLALAASLGQTGRVSTGMLTAAAEALPGLLSAADLAEGRVYPSLADPRRVAAHVAARVLEAAAGEGRVTDRKARRALERAAAAAHGAAPHSNGAPDPLATWVRGTMFEPVYKSSIRLPMGVRNE